MWCDASGVKGRRWQNGINSRSNRRCGYCGRCCSGSSICDCGWCKGIDEGRMI